MISIDDYRPIQTNALPRNDKLKNLIWSIINSTIFRITPPHLTFFRKLRVAILRMFGAKIDWTASIHPTAKIEYPWNLTIGKMSSLGERSWTYCMNTIEIGEKTCIGKNVFLLTGSHNISSPNFNLITKPIKIGNCCWITTNVKILPGITIGDFAVISVDSVVVKDVEPWNVIGGNPAIFIKKRIIS